MSLGLFSGDDLRKMEDIAGQMLRGLPWEGTIEATRGDGSHALMRVLAVPLRHPGGDIDGMVILAREASKRDGQFQQDRIALLERVGERLAGLLEIETVRCIRWRRQRHALQLRTDPLLLSGMTTDSVAYWAW